MADAVLLDTIADPVTAESEEQRSRFLATLAPVVDETAAGAVIAALRAEHHAARHHCTAIVLGPSGQRRRSSDDGEPAGTAGAPMLAVLTGAGLTDVVAVVTRYFGGTLLGAGGLVRAYGGVLGDAVAAANRLARRPVTRVRVEVPMAAVGRVEHLLHQAPAELHLDVRAGTYTPSGAGFEVVVDDAVGVDALAAWLAGVADEVVLTDLGSAIRSVPAAPPDAGHRQAPSRAD